MNQIELTTSDQNVFQYTQFIGDFQSIQGFRRTLFGQLATNLQDSRAPKLF